MMKKLSSQVPTEMHIQLKRAALDKNQTLQQALTEAIRQFLVPDEKARSTEEPLLNSVEEILQSGNEVAIANITTAINASTALLNIMGGGGRRRPIVTKLSSTTARVPVKPGGKRLKPTG